MCTHSRHMKAEVWSCALHFSFQSAQRLSHKVHARTEKRKKKATSTAAVLSRCWPGSDADACCVGGLYSGIFLMVLIESGRSDPFSAKVISRDPENGLGCGVLSFTFLHPEFFSAPSLLTPLSLQRGTPFTPPHHLKKIILNAV